MNKSQNLLQTLKILVLANSLSLLVVMFLVFFNQPTQAQKYDSEPQTVSMNTNNANKVQPTNLDNATNQELENLPYVSANGLGQQVQPISYEQQPRVKARASR